MLRACDVQNGMMFMQCVVQDGLPYVYDIGYRLTGSLEHHNQKVSAGYSSMDMLLNYAVKGRMTDDLDIETKIKTGLYAPSYNISLLMKPGTIDHFEGIESALQRESVIACVKAHIEGETFAI